MRNERWTVALHECGHALVGIDLGYCVERLVIGADGGYCKFAGDHSLGHSHAVMCAAGPAAEVLAGRFDPPEAHAPETAEAQAERADIDAEVSESHRMLIAGWRYRDIDELHLRRFAIDADDRNPKVWLERLESVEADARRLVEVFSREIVMLASELYKRGVLREGEIAKLLGLNENNEPRS